MQSDSDWSPTAETSIIIRGHIANFDDQGRIVVAGRSSVGDAFTGTRFGVVARLMP